MKIRLHKHFNDGDRVLYNGILGTVIVSGDNPVIITDDLHTMKCRGGRLRFATPQNIYRERLRERLAELAEQASIYLSQF